MQNKHQLEWARNFWHNYPLTYHKPPDDVIGELALIAQAIIADAEDDDPTPTIPTVFAEDE